MFRDCLLTLEVMQEPRKVSNPPPPLGVPKTTVVVMTGWQHVERGRESGFEF